MDYMENQFFKNEQIQPWIWFRYIDIFFIWTASEKEHDFLEWHKGNSNRYEIFCKE